MEVDILRGRHDVWWRKEGRARWKDWMTCRSNGGGCDG
jgi:hypothetical protein